MNSNSYFPVVVDLSPFFYDHRRTARVFVNNAIKSVYDLQNRIQEIFSIKDFYLTTGGHFLPELEDIGILQRNEIVCVIPKGPPNKIIEKTKEKSKNEKRRALEVIAEETEITSPKTKKSKKKHHSPSNEKLSRATETDVNEPKAKRSRWNIEEDVPELVHKKKKSNREKQHSAQEEICNIESVLRVNDIKQKLKEKTEEHIKKYSKSNEQSNENLKKLLPKLQDHIKLCNDFGRANLPDTVRLSRHSDTPIKKFTKYIPPARITDQYIAKNKVNIVRIDIVKSTNDHANNTVTEHDKDSPPKNSVKEIINSFEESFSHEISETNNDELTTNELVESEEKINGVSDNHCINFDEKSLNMSDPSTPFKKEIICESIVDVVPKSLSTDMSLDASPIKQNTVSMDDCSVTSLNSTNNSNKLDSIRSFSSHKSYSGIGRLLDSLKESDHVFSLEDDNSSEYVTKRKRVRTRKRKKVSKEGRSEEPEITKLDVNTWQKSSLPNIHIKFEDNAGGAKENNYLEQITDAENRNGSCIAMEAVLVAEHEKSVMEDKDIYSEANILSSPSIEGLPPKIGDIVAFKVLKITEDYTPQLSNFIIGKVVIYTPDIDQVFFKILKGKEEFIIPAGKLSVDQDGHRDFLINPYKDFSWSELMEKRKLPH